MSTIPLTKHRKEQLETLVLAKQEGDIQARAPLTQEGGEKHTELPSPWPAAFALQ